MMNSNPEKSCSSCLHSDGEINANLFFDGTATQFDFGDL